MKKTIFVFALSALFLTSCKKAENVAAESTNTTTVETTTQATGKIETASFTIEGMSCEIMCASKIQKELAATEGVEKATVDFEKKTATVEYDSGVISPEQLVEKVEAVNGGDSYKVSNLTTSADHASLFQEKEKKKTRKQRKAEEKAAAEASKNTTTETNSKPGCCSSKKACSKKETM
ncbi:heavy metal-associated domain-containing protein [Flavobacterium sp.]|uniref:heavy-metal-associated domain-containing protein n=1 Tax=Flavobacterium sp. TaxID=239 RepID=UPI00261CF803|nr:heavy metal-associated domain-containing protein [Flavobacterium sp.]MDD3004688.1 heavy metal-associated domain-containing protein [Flavobacterium sp.]